MLSKVIWIHCGRWFRNGTVSGSIVSSSRRPTILARTVSASNCGRKVCGIRKGTAFSHSSCRIDTKDKLNKITDFRSISSLLKIACHIELLFSPAKAVFEIGCDDFTSTGGDTDDKKYKKGNHYDPPSLFKKLTRTELFKKTYNTFQCCAFEDGRLSNRPMTKKADIDQI